MNENTHTLKYLEVYETLRNDILMKKYPNNTLLPTELQLMKDFGVGRNTVRRALKQLKDENYISTQRGSGSLVCYEALSKGVQAESASWVSRCAEVEYYVPIEKIHVSPSAIDRIIPPLEITQAMNLSSQSKVFRSQSIRFINEIPYIYMIHYINPEIMPDFNKHFKSTPRIETILNKIYGLKEICTTEHITCCNAGFVEANLLNVEPGTALEYTYRIAECEKGVFEYGIFYGNPAYTGYRVIIDGAKTEEIPDCEEYL